MAEGCGNAVFLDRLPDQEGWIWVSLRSALQTWGSPGGYWGGELCMVCHLAIMLLFRQPGQRPAEWPAGGRVIR